MLRYRRQAKCIRAYERTVLALLPRSRPAGRIGGTGAISVRVREGDVRPLSEMLQGLSSRNLDREVNGDLTANTANRRFSSRKARTGEGR